MPNVLRRLFLACTAALPLVLATACGGGGSNTGQSATGASLSTTATAAPQDTVLALKVTRLDATNGPAAITNGVPLPPGLLKDAALGSVRVFVGGAEQAIYVEPLGRRYPDGSIRSLLLQFGLPRLDAGQSLAGELRIGTTARDPGNTIAKQPTASLLGAAALPAKATDLASTRVAGPLIAYGATPTTPAYIDGMNRSFEQIAPAIYEATKDSAYRYTATYDHVLEHYQQWLRTADPVWFARANKLGDTYFKTGMALACPGCFAEWHNEPQNSAIHFLLTGHEPVRTVLRGQASWWLWVTELPGLNSFAYGGDWRITSRAMLAALECWNADCGTILSFTNAPYDLVRILDSYPARVEALQDPDGSFRGAPGGIHAGEQKNFMAGMLMRSLVRYHAEYKADPRIVPVLKKQADFVWTTQWDAALKGLPYCSTVTPGVTQNTGTDCGPSVYAGLNSFHLPLFGYLYALTGDTTYRDRGDALLDGLLTSKPNWPAFYKQFDQAYSGVFNYFAWRQGVR